MKRTLSILVAIILLGTTSVIADGSKITIHMKKRTIIIGKSVFKNSTIGAKIKATKQSIVNLRVSNSLDIVNRSQLIDSTVGIDIDAM